jgi:hypothetical protein
LHVHSKNTKSCLCNISCQINKFNNQNINIHLIILISRFISQLHWDVNPSFNSLLNEMHDSYRKPATSKSTSIQIDNSNKNIMSNCFRHDFNCLRWFIALNEWEYQFKFPIQYEHGNEGSWNWIELNWIDLIWIDHHPNVNWNTKLEDEIDNVIDLILWIIFDYHWFWLILIDFDWLMKFSVMKQRKMMNRWELNQIENKYVQWDEIEHLMNEKLKNWKIENWKFG